MKKRNFMLPLLALLFATVAAFAFQPKADDDDVYWVVAGEGCQPQTECTLMSPGIACDFQVKNASCGNITRYRLQP